MPAEPSPPRPAPAALVDGLAGYRAGAGPAVLVVPNPQGMVRVPEAAGPLVRRVVESGRTAVTFDPPGAFASTRPPRLDVAEMVGACAEIVAALGPRPPVDVVAHSQATLVALALALDRPELVRRLVLVGAVDGGAGTTRRAGGMPWCWPLTDRRFRRFVRLALPLSLGRADVARLKRVQALFTVESFVDRTRAPVIAVEPGDRHRRPPARARWQWRTRAVDLRPRLGEVAAPALVCVGRHDPQTPWPANRAIAEALPQGRLVVFDRSGHYPHVEEAEDFTASLARFLTA